MKEITILREAVFEDGNALIEVREAGGEKFNGELFASCSEYKMWEERGYASVIDEWIYGYVDDDIFRSLSDDEFDEYVNKYFD